MPSVQGYQKVPQRTNDSASSNSSSRSTINDGDLGIARPDERQSMMAVGVTGNSGSGGGNLPTTYSSQQLMGGDSESVTASLDTGSTVDAACGADGRPHSRNSRQYGGLGSITYTEWFTVTVLCFVNLINYMDRFTIAGE